MIGNISTRHTPFSPRRETTTRSAAQTRAMRVRRRCLVIAGVVVLAATLYLAVDAEASWAYTMDLRGRQLGALVVVGAAVGASSLVFQTVSGSRILTPAVMGFDALYVLIQTVVVYVFGPTALQLMGAPERFVLNTFLLVLFGVGLFGVLFRAHHRNLFALVLVGIILGTLFSSLATLASRMLSPDDYLTLQSVLFASFNTVDGDLLLITTGCAAAALGGLVPLLRRLDVVELGRDRAISLGVDHHRAVTWALVAVTVLVAVSTALVGPMLFLGLLAANLTRQLLPTYRHLVLVPAAAAVGAASTVSGQLIVTQIFGLNTTLSVVINLVGGLYFLVLLLKAARL